MSFTDMKPRIVTKEDLTAPWSGHTDGSRFYCRLCGHLFEEGDTFRWVPAIGVSLSNLLVCSKCDGDNEDVVRRWGALWDEWIELSKGKFRFVAIRLSDAAKEIR